MFIRGIRAEELSRFFIVRSIIRIDRGRLINNRLWLNRSFVELDFCIRIVRIVFSFLFVVDEFRRRIIVIVHRRLGGYHTDSIAIFHTVKDNSICP